MLMGHTDGLSEMRSSKDRLLSDPESGLEDEDDDSSEPILYSASFDELARNVLKYEMVIWLSISLLLVLAWGVGIIMLLYLPIRRYVLQKDISSRKLYVTPSKIVYKVSRPSFIPFWGTANIEKYVPLYMVIDIIIEQGCLQSVYGIHTFRVESISHGKAAPVDELQVQGVSNPGLLRKVIVTEASKIMQDVGRGRRPAALTTEGEGIGRGGSLTDGSTIMRSPMKTLKMTSSPRHSPRYPSSEPRGTVTGELLLHKLEEVNKSVKKLEFLVEKSRASPESS